MERARVEEKLELVQHFSERPGKVREIDRGREAQAMARYAILTTAQLDAISMLVATR